MHLVGEWASWLPTSSGLRVLVETLAETISSLGGQQVRQLGLDSCFRNGATKAKINDHSTSN